MKVIHETETNKFIGVGSSEEAAYENLCIISGHVDNDVKITYRIIQWHASDTKIFKEKAEQQRLLGLPVNPTYGLAAIVDAIIKKEKLDINPYKAKARRTETVKKFNWIKLRYETIIRPLSNPQYCFLYKERGN